MRGSECRYITRYLTYKYSTPYLLDITSQHLLLGSLQLAYAGRHMGKFVRAFHSLFLRLLERNEKLPERVGFGALVLIVCGLAGINSILDRQPAPEQKR